MTFLSKTAKISLPSVAGHASLGRFGLGHSLLAWARCYLWCKDHDVPMLEPRWCHLRIGPYLRREADKRSYHKLFRKNSYVGGFRRLAILCFSEKLPYNTNIDMAALKNTKAALVVFRNDASNNERYFKEIIGRHVDIREELLRITRVSHRLPCRENRKFIGIHVRCGDFSVARHPDDVKTSRNVRIPISWFVDILRGLRARIRLQIPAIVFSDGSRTELASLLREERVTLACGPSAISDMFHLSSAGVIVASGSGFSMWATYLGQTPRICYPGQRRERVLETSGIDLEPECECPDNLSDEFISSLTSRLAPVANASSERPS